ncbi:hypothetical protein, partial [Enterococcus faecium]|uniref:hypothetical protein n=1 Tax=Enterococcus faecium TaxID=1352 RepID=UPI003F4206BF
IPSLDVALNWKPSAVAAVTAGAVKVAMPLLPLVSVTIGPLVCVQAEPVAVPLVTWPCSVTVLPTDVVTADPAVTVVARRG